MQYLEKPTRAKRWEYKRARRGAKRIIRSKKRKYLNAIILRMEQDFKKNKSREVYKAVNLFKKRYIPRSYICKDKDGAVVAGRERVLNRWREYFSLLLNPNSTQTREQSAELLVGEEEDFPKR